MRIVYGTTVLANPDAEQPITDYALSAQQTVSMADIAIAPYNAPDSRGNRSATLSFPAPRIFDSLADAQAYTSDLYADLPAKADLVLTVVRRARRHLHLGAAPQGVVGGGAECAAQVQHAGGGGGAREPPPAKRARIKALAKSLCPT